MELAMLWLKSFHIIGMVAWFAGLFYLPRLFVYHASLEKSEAKAYQRFCTMERRLYRGIMAPSAVITLVLGVGLVHSMGWSFRHPPLWLTLKLILIGLLIIYHLYCGQIIKKFAHTQNQKTATFYRWFNEVPTVLLTFIVLLVVIKPW